MVAVKAGDRWTKPVLVVGGTGLVGESVTAGGKGTRRGELAVTALVESVGRDTGLGDFGTMVVFS